MTLTVVHWIPEDSMCAITLPLIAPTRAASAERQTETRAQAEAHYKARP